MLTKKVPSFLQHFATLTYSPSLKCRGFSTVARLSPLADAFNLHSSSPNLKSKKGSTGLFCIPELIEANGFQKLVDGSLKDCYALFQEAISEGRQRKIVQILDDISDTLCRVADLADCMRMLHPDENYRLAASRACQAVGEFVEDLNTNEYLYGASKRATQQNSSRISADLSMDAVDKRVLDLFVADFELSGVQLQDSHRHTLFVRSATAAMKLGAEFIEACHRPIFFSPASTQGDLCGLNSIPIQLTHPLSDHPNETMRLVSYQAYYAPIDGQEARLEQLLDARHNMACAAGFSSFNERATLHSLAETPERVYEFLHHLCHGIRPLAYQTMQAQLLPIITPIPRKSKRENSKSATKIRPCDIPYALGLRRRAINVQGLADYFSLGVCMEGISQLAECLFGLHLRVDPCEPGEIWHPNVIKVGIYSSHISSPENKVGTVYCDLLDRPGKPLQDCHYTIRGGRYLVHSQNYQFPIITLQLNFCTDSDSNCEYSPPLLSLGQVENLFHEWGHALHSILARTRYQHVTGTRCSTDLAELPSTLFEHFALDPRVTKEYVRHWKTGKKPNNVELAALQRLSVGRGLGQSIEISQQATYALLDQVLHSGCPNDILSAYSNQHNKDLSFWPRSAKLLSDIQHKAGLSEWVHCGVEHIGAWPHRFSHLTNYGGRYYAYLMARAGADLVWRRCFADDPWSSAQGQRYAEKLLCRGGEYHPTVMLSNLLNSTDSDGHCTNASTTLLSPVKLADGLITYLEESEAAVSTLLKHYDSPGLYQPQISV